jgi:hypothetical protein
MHARFALPNTSVVCGYKRDTEELTCCSNSVCESLGIEQQVGMYEESACRCVPGREISCSVARISIIARRIISTKGS